MPLAHGTGISTSANVTGLGSAPLVTLARNHFDSVTATTPLALQKAACDIPLLRYLQTSLQRSLSEYRLRPVVRVFVICVFMPPL